MGGASINEVLWGFLTFGHSESKTITRVNCSVFLSARLWLIFLRELLRTAGCVSQYRHSLSKHSCYSIAYLQTEHQRGVWQSHHDLCNQAQGSVQNATLSPLETRDHLRLSLPLWVCAGDLNALVLPKSRMDCSQLCMASKGRIGAPIFSISKGSTKTTRFPVTGRGRLSC